MMIRTERVFETSKLRSLQQAVTLCACSLTAATTAHAQPAPPEAVASPAPADETVDQPTPAAEPDRSAPTADAEESDTAADAAELSPAELAEIQAAVGADAEEIDDDKGDAAPTDSTTSWTADAAALLPDISIILDAALAIFSEEDPLQTGGHDPQETGFNLQQLELSMYKNVDPYFRFDTNIVFSLYGVEVEEAYGTTLDLPAGLQIRAGQFLTRFGRINASHPHSWDFVDQPFMIGKVFGGEGNRGLGVELSWLTPLPWFVEIVGSTTDGAGESTARSFYGPEDQGIGSPLDFQNTAAIKQFFELSDNWSLMWGLSAANGPNPHGKDTRSDVYGTDIYLKYRPITRASYTIVSLQAEWLYRRRQIPLDVIYDTGGYAQLLWRFAQRWATAGRYEYGSPTRYDSGGIAVDPLDPDQTTSRQRVSSNVTFWPTEFSRLRLQGSADFPKWRDKPILAGMLALELVTGSHGAHQF